MTEPELTAEERVLRMMKRVLTNTVKDTAPRPGRRRHPLSETTIRKIRECLCLITAREQELAGEYKRDTSARPRFIDEPEAVVPLVIGGLTNQAATANAELESLAISGALNPILLAVFPARSGIVEVVCENRTAMGTQRRY